MTKTKTKTKKALSAKMRVVQGPCLPIHLSVSGSKLMRGLHVAWEREGTWTMWINYVCIDGDWSESIPHPMDLDLVINETFQFLAPADCARNVCGRTPSAKLFEEVMIFMLNFWKEANARHGNVLSWADTVRQAYRSAAELFGYVFED